MNKDLSLKLYNHIVKIKLMFMCIVKLRFYIRLHFCLFRVYNPLNKKALSNSCVLVSESETNLKSADDYKAVLNLEFECCPQLIPYLNTFVIPCPGDWPTWYFVKKLIAHSDEQSALNSIIPEQGPFHVILNATEDTVILFHFFFNELYGHLFRKELPIKPKPFQVSIVTTAVFLGWLLIREMVQKKFKLCKDVEYVMMLHLLDEVLPLLFYHYREVVTSTIT